MRIFRKLAQLLDVDVVSTPPADGDSLTYDTASSKWVPEAVSGGGGGAPTDADYLVGTANGSLSAEIVVGTSPGGELGGTWASPTVDTVHSGSSHASVQAAAEATAASALSTHAGDTTGVHGIADTSALLDTGDIGSTVPAIGVFDDHSARHENGGADEISVAGLSGLLADAQTAAAHASSHQDGGADEISIAGLSGTSAALQAHLDDTADAHDASAVSVADSGGNYTATDVEGVLAEIAPQLGGGGGSGTGLDGYESRSSNTILGTGDAGKVIDFTASITQTFTAAATLGSGWWVILRNATTDGTTVVTLDPDSTETIDAVGQPKMYSGETRLIVCDGTGFHSTMLQGGYAKFTSGGSFRVPAGIVVTEVECIGPGGGGGAGHSGGQPRSGGGGGGGGAAVKRTVRAEDLGSAGTDITVTVPSGGAGGSGAGVAGSDASATTFGSHVTGYGGGGGGGGASGSNSTGGGGSSWMTAASGTTSGAPTSSGAAASQSGQSGAGAVQGNAELGGASGGGSIAGNADPGAGGSAVKGGAGGGGGGGRGSGGARAGAAGGKRASYVAGGGGTAGAVSGGVGGDGAAGQAGGGGAAHDSGAGGAGGAGGAPGCGGGGGGTGSTGAGNGGAGGRGECRVWYS